MEHLWSYLLIAVAGYLLGSISVSVLLSKYAFHRDVRSAGSGNAGASNVARTFGLGAGIVTFLGDFTKTLLALLLGKWLAGDWGLCVGGCAALIGHCLPLFFHFKGGKAVSAGVAVAVMLGWKVILPACVVFALAALLSKTASIASTSAALAVMVGTVLFAPQPPTLVLGLFTGALVLFMHRSNFKRILSGTEPKFRPGKRPTQKQ